MNKLNFYVDGSSIGNPGQGGIGIVVCDHNGKVVTTYKSFLPCVTNNEAEYYAVLRALKLAQKLNADEVKIFSDSELIVRQLNSSYKVREPNLQKLYEKVMSLARKFRSFTVHHIPRQKNKRANLLAQQVAKVVGKIEKNLSEVKHIKIAPSILSADFRQLGKVVREIETAGADWIHFDVMDGRFVPNISFGLPVVEALRSETNLPFDVHLMIVEPERYIERFIKAGANIVSVHLEATYHLHRAVNLIKELGAKASVAINPATPPEAIRNILPMLDVVLVMSVDPGFVGQKFLPFTLDKVRALRRWIEELGLETELEIDGGVNNENASDCVKAGSSILVSASGIFQSQTNITQAIRNLRESADI